jgi:phosphate starvation-inducible PhoH-like protein
MRGVLILSLLCCSLSKNMLHTSRLLTLKPRTPNQISYVNALSSNTLVFCLGSAGTGKTLFACNEAMKQLQKGDIDKIIITRPIVAVEDEQLGFLPGNINKKMDPWTRPIFDIFSEYCSMNEITKMVKDGIIEISPLAYMRGRTFKNAFIIADEMQNSSPNQMLMLTTRLGEGSKMVVTGDLKQSDRSLNNGLSDFLEKFNGYSKNCSISVIRMTGDDVERSEIVKTILDIYSPKPSYYENVTKEYLTNVKRSSRTEPIVNDAAMIPKHLLDRSKRG